MLDKTFIGQRVSRLDIGRAPEPVSRVTLVVDGETSYTAGDDTGRTIEKTVPWATQIMAESVLRRLQGITYRPFDGTDALLDPAAEVGDGITIGGVYSTLAKADVTYDGLYTADIAAPGGSEIEDEYPYKSRSQREAARELAKIRSSITKTAERITLLVENEVEGLRGELTLTAESLTAQIENTEKGLNGKLELTAESFEVAISQTNGNVSTLSQTVDGISSTVETQGGAISTISQRVESISLKVTNGESSSTIALYKDGIAMEGQTISFTGMVTFNDINGNHGTTIDGGAIDTNTLKLNALHGDIIYLYNSEHDMNPWIGASAEIKIGNASSSYDRFELSARSIYLEAWQGDLFLSSNSGAEVQLGGGADGVHVAITGNLIPNSDSRYSCGASWFRWVDVYATNGTIVTSDRTQKKDISYDLDRYGALFDRLRPVSYKLINGQSGRTHLGLIAQDVEAALGECGLTDMDFAGLIRSPREDGGYDYALRYGEIIAMLIREVQELKRRIS